MTDRSAPFPADTLAQWSHWPGSVNAVDEFEFPDDVADRAESGIAPCDPQRRAGLDPIAVGDPFAIARALDPLGLSAHVRSLRFHADDIGDGSEACHPTRRAEKWPS